MLFTLLFGGDIPHMNSPLSDFTGRNMVTSHDHTVMTSSTEKKKKPIWTFMLA